MSYHQDDGRRSVYHSNGGCLIAIFALPVALLRALWKVWR